MSVRVCVCVCAQCVWCVGACAGVLQASGASKRSTHTINGIFCQLFNFVSLFMFLLYLILCI